MTLVAYHNDPEIKSAILKELIAHDEADEIVKGKYWENGKGCAVGCSLESWRVVRNLPRINHSSHAIYDDIFGLGGQMLAQLEDCIFEGLPNGKSKAWPIRFMSAIQPGKDLSLVGWKFLHWILTDETVNPGISHPIVKDAVAQAAQVICALSKGEPLDKSEAESAKSAAWSAKSAAWSAEIAAWSAKSAAWSAESAAWSAESAAWSAESAAKSAAWSAESAARSAKSAAWSAAKSAAWSAAYIKMSDRLIELIEEA